jgi:DNA (cytosine-5)-methyltransferase 1
LTLTHGSLFSGVGGFDMGADNAGLVTKWQCEIDKKPRSVLKKHWPDIKQYEDVKDVKGNEIEPVDVISFGSPCQDLSVAGKRKGLTGERSGLFHQAIRIAKEMQDATEGQYPRFIIWENVRGALSSNEGKDFEKVIEEMASLGAVDISWRLLNTTNFGPPQRRVRVFVIADLRGNCAREILSQPTRLLWHPPKGKQKRKGTTRKTKASSGSTDTYRFQSFGGYKDTDRASTIKSRDYKDATDLIVDETIYFKPHLEDGARVQTNTMGTLTANMGTGGNNVPMVAEVYSKAKRAENTEDYESWKEGVVSPTLNAMDNTSESFATVIAIQDARDINKKQNGSGINDDAKVMYTIDTASEHAVATFAITEREGKPGGGKGLLMTEELSPTLSTANTQRIAEPTQTTYKVRRLTPKECERLQGWPDDHTKYDSDGNELSDSARYKMCGNGISTPVAQWICENLVKAVAKEQQDT